MNKYRNQNGFAAGFIVLAIVTCLIVGIAVKLTVDNHKQQKSVAAEKALYDDLYSQASRYTNIIKADYPSGIATNSKYCSYASVEYGKGTLSCTVMSQLKFDTKSIDTKDVLTNAEAKLNNLKWGNREVKSDPAQGVLLGVTYPQRSGVVCGVDAYYREGELLLSVNCSGDALAEYYPVKN